MSVIDVETNFNHYSESLFDGYNKILDLSQSKVRTDIAFLEVYYFFLNFVADEGFLNQRHKTEQILYAKLSSDVFAILTNLSAGCISQAMTILRSLFETTIYAKFISENPEIRLNLYSDFSIVQKQRLNEQDGRKDDELKRQYDLIKHKFHLQKQWYTKHLLEIINSNSHYKNKKPSIRTLSLIVGMQKEYDVLYSVLSHAGHGNSILENVYIQKGHFNAGPVYLPYWNELIARIAVNYASKCFKSIMLLNSKENILSYIEYSELLSYKIMMESMVNQNKDEQDEHNN
ncbi:hypothetical protein J7E81_15385 [Bacillus sp. ISL-18]|uniref:DUF5677 domain-containing protein n=1 Tax=Bacillus sp. ISL-18 TaxID=2819118 RepID=UPI001BEB814D|nr:DUF5677 domain-containing protein [Bacillus sp. ISL-18]MBT2656601.1 hypothetical protein [Bacillus sp. ISL-18]